MDKLYKQIPLTKVPLTAEAREKLLEELFADELPHPGELFIPDDSFYNANTGHKQAEHMMKLLCRWLGIKPGYIGLEFEFSKNTTVDGRRYTIYIELSTLKDEFVLGGFLAHALTCYLVEQRKQIHLPDTDQHAALLASASIMFGLAIVVMNGLDPSYNLLQRLKHNISSLRGFPLSNYIQMSLSFFRRHQINQNTFHFSLAPWTEKRLGLKKFRRPSRAVHDVRHKIKVANSKLLGLGWLALLILCLGSFVIFQRIKPMSAKLKTAEQNVSLLNNLTRLCKDAVAYDRQYADTSDIQTVRALNAESLRCQSLENRYNAAEQHYQKLLNE